MGHGSSLCAKYLERIVKQLKKITGQRPKTLHPSMEKSFRQGNRLLAQIAQTVSVQLKLQ